MKYLSFASSDSPDRNLPTEELNALENWCGLDQSDKNFISMQNENQSKRKLKALFLKHSGYKP